MLEEFTPTLRSDWLKSRGRLKVVQFVAIDRRMHIIALNRSHLIPRPHADLGGRIFA